MERAISVGDFETPLDALKAGANGVHAMPVVHLVGVGLGLIPTQPSNGGLDSGKTAHHFCVSLTRCHKFSLHGLEGFENQFVCDVLAHGRTIPAIGDASNCLPSHISNPPEGPPPSDRGGPAGLSLSQSSQDRSAALSTQEPMAPA